MQVLLLLEMLAIGRRVGEGALGWGCCHLLLDGLVGVGGYEPALPSAIAAVKHGLLWVVMISIANTAFLVVVMAALATSLGRGRLVRELLPLMLLGGWWQQLGHLWGLLHRRRVD